MPDLVMLVGAPRSGTTWLQTLLGAHDAIATPQETDLFRVYLEPLVAAWDKQLAGATDGQDARRRKGLPLTLTEQEFDAAAAQLLTTTLDAVRRMKPSARVVVEKSPAHSLCVATILRFAPDARFLHIVRDGRDAVASLLAASESWGSRWAPDSVARGARVWRNHLLGAREARTTASSYLEIRYEDLRGSRGPELLAAAYAIAGVELSEVETAGILDEHSFERQSESGEVASSILLGGEAGTTELARQEPAGFFRKGEIGGWRNEWSVDDRRAFASVAGDLLVDLGYERDDSWIGARTSPTVLTRARHRFANSTAHALRALADRVERLPIRR
jgi:hypothetical protein